MDMDDSQQLHTVLVENWSLPEDTLPTQDTLLVALTARVQDMIATRPHKLGYAMYALDVSEEKFESALTLPDLEDQALAVAQLILLREAQKVESWNRYQQMKRQQPLESLED